MTFTYKTVTDSAGEKIVFMLPLDDSGPVYMKCDLTGIGQDDIRIIFVDAEKLVAACKAGPAYPIGRIAKGNRQTWPNDRKYSGIDRKFLRSKKYPVGLAEIGWRDFAHVLETRRFLGLFKIKKGRVVPNTLHFKNGITRTLWLLSHGCKTFPAICISKEPERNATLIELIGVPGSRVMYPIDFLGDADNRE